MQTPTAAPPAVRLSDTEVAAWRTRFPILARRTYLANHTLGAMPDTVPAALARFAEEWATDGVEAWRAWLPQVRTTADLLGSLLGAPPGSVVLHQNVATLTAMLLAALPRDEGRTRVLLAADEWPSHHHLLAGQRQLGLEPVVVPSTDALLEAVDERAALVLTSHVRFRDSRILDLPAVVAAARSAGALVLADGYHAAGHMPVDVTALGVDAYVGGSVKWLCGGPGVGWLYLAPGVHERLRPVELGWLGHARPFAFENTWEPADGAVAWLGGTPGVAAVVTATQGYDVIAEVGPARVRATSAHLTQALVDAAVERGLAVASPLESAERAGTVVLDLGPHSEAAAARLIDAGVTVDHRPGAGIRVGPHFFSTAAECARALDVVARG